MPNLRHLSALLLAMLGLCHERAESHEVRLTVLDPIAIAWREELSWTQMAVEQPQTADPALAIFGPFRVTSPDSADMVGLVDSASPGQFAAMLKAYPGIRVLRMIECPGSEDDEANLRLARMVRSSRIETVVPAGGSVRSGAVELFLAGVRRSADSRAEFAVHSWRDELGREAGDLPPDDPIHREYIDYYREIGLSEADAATFYALTNSVPHDDAVYLAPLQLAQMGLLEVL